jgi:hypothetical protein
MSSDEKVELTDQGLPAADIEDPVDTDVLCGRGGAALRHPGNQTYRRLVHLNKGLYITCLKAEKLKISRSIVAAIREQKGRFLERDTKKGTWYDIGDKKAMEKTSQALREGQPKLRQKIVELGGGAAGAAALLETQFPGGSVYSMNQQQQAQAQIEQQTMQHLQQQQNMQHQNMQQQQDFQQQQMHNMQQQGMFNSAEAMPPPRSRGENDMGGMMMGNQPQASMSMMETPTIQEEPGSMRSSAGNLGIDQYAASQFSLMSDFSSYAGMDQPSSGGGGMPSMPPPISTQGSAGLMETPNLQSSRKHHSMDRRKHFACMKYSRPPSGRFNSGSNRQLYSSSKQLYASNRSLGADGMPDIHLVESNPSLFSNVSAQSGGEQARVPDIANIFESRRSMMSGLSRISDASDMNSIFSDLSRKIGNISTRSIAMSEISNMDEHELHELDPGSIPTDNMHEFPGEM